MADNKRLAPPGGDLSGIPSGLPSNKSSGSTRSICALTDIGRVDDHTQRTLEKIWMRPLVDLPTFKDLPRFSTRLTVIVDGHVQYEYQEGTCKEEVCYPCG